MIKNRNGKGQAAIEFLITYGWAIMAVMIVIGALAYFGVTNPATSLPDKCMFSNAFQCKDFQITSNLLRIKLVNIGGETIYGDPVNGINALLTDNDAPCTTVSGGAPVIVPYLDPESEIEIECLDPPNSPFNTKEKAKVKVTINYLKNPSGYNQVSLGEVYSTVQ
jgi:hypothetical protein